MFHVKHLSQPREVQKKKPRMDMGAALRNTTLTRRPVDFFFGEETKELRKKVTATSYPFLELNSQKSKFLIFTQTANSLA